MSLPVLLRRFPWGLPAPDRNTRLIMASLALFLLLWIPLVSLGFDPDSSAAPLWQHAWFHASMWLFLASSFLLAWKGLSFLEFRWRLPASLLTFLPLLLVWYLVEWHWSGSPMRLEEPRLVLHLHDGLGLFHDGHGSPALGTRHLRHRRGRRLGGSPPGMGLALPTARDLPSPVGAAVQSLRVPGHAGPSFPGLTGCSPAGFYSSHFCRAASSRASRSSWGIWRSTSRAISASSSWMASSARSLRPASP